MNKRKPTIEISILKHEDRSELINNYKNLANAEFQLASSLEIRDDDEDEMRRIQTAKEEAFHMANAPMSYEEITYLRGYSFVAKYFNPSGDRLFYELPIDITREQIAAFVNECDLALENPEVAESVLPVIPRYETPVYAEDDIYEEYPNFYLPEYFDKVRRVREIFNDVLNNTQWGEEAIAIQILR